MKKIPKLDLKLWQELIYFLFIAIVPTIIAAVELFSVGDTPSAVSFKISFASVGALLLVIIILRKFVFKNYIDKLQAKCVLLEHDYSIEVGNSDNVKVQWARHKIVIYVYNAIIVAIALALAVLFISAIAEQLLKFRGASIIIFSSVLVGILWKLVIYIVRASK